MITKGRGILMSNPSFLRKVVFYIGDYVLIGCVVYFGYLYFPLVKALLFYNFSPTTKKDPNVAQELAILPTMAPIFDFRVNIPKIAAKSEIKAGVDPYEVDKYLEVLEQGFIAQAKDSDFPGTGKGASTYLFAHSTEQGIGAVRINSVFYLLGELIKGDNIWVDYNGKRYLYTVYDKKIVNPKEIAYLDYSDPEREVVILQTCWPIGTDWNRLLVFGELKEII